MNVLLIGFLTLAAVGVIGALVVVCLNPTSIDEGAAFQALATLVAGALALGGAWMTIQTMKEQIQLQHNEIERLQIEEKKKNYIELDHWYQTLKHPLSLTTTLTEEFEKIYAEELQKNTKEEDLWKSPLPKDLAEYYQSRINAVINKLNSTKENPDNLDALSSAALNAFREIQSQSSLKALSLKLSTPIKPTYGVLRNPAFEGHATVLKNEYQAIHDFLETLKNEAYSINIEEQK